MTFSVGDTIQMNHDMPDHDVVKNRDYVVLDVPDSNTVCFNDPLVPGWSSGPRSADCFHLAEKPGPW